MNATSNKYPFGWIESHLSCTTAEFQISPAQDFSKTLAIVIDEGIASDKWIYPPIDKHFDQDVAAATGRFELPPTHNLIIDASLDRPGMANSLILILGFFLGLKLNPVGIGHLHKTPRRMGELVSFTSFGRDLERAMKHVIKFLHMHETHGEIRSLTEAAFHWYLVSQSYAHQFEEFGFQYSVLDNIHKISKLIYPTYSLAEKARRGHIHRPIILSEHYNIPLPSIFEDGGAARPNAKKLTDARNALVHEARWLGKPLGYAVDDASHHLLSDLRYFNSQLLLAVLGIECSFRSMPNPWQTQGLDVTN
jgi:hypothetical protein